MAGVSLSTIKYYLREGLLPPGTPTSPTQASYDTTHVERLRLVRALVEVAGLSIAAVRGVLASLESPAADLHAALGSVHCLLPPPVEGDVDVTAAERLLDHLGWQVHPDSPTIRVLARAMEALVDGGLATGPTLEEYADVARRLAEVEVGGVPRASAEEAVRYVDRGTILYEPVLLALRRLAQEDASSRRFGGADAGSFTDAGPGTDAGPAADAEEPDAP